jgi:membrane protein DedA with SNARE-associated domain
VVDVFNFGETALRHLLSTYGYWAVMAFVGIESIGIPLPGETMLIAAAIYAGASHQLSIELVISAAIVGAVVGDNIGFAIGYFGGYRLLVRYGRYIGLHERRVKLARYIFMKHGPKVVFFGRFVSVLRTYAAFLAGTARMPWWRFLTFNAAGGITWALAYGVGAYLLGQQLNRLSRPFEYVAAGLAVIAIVVFAVFLRRNERRLEDEAERALPGPLEAPQ